MPSVTVYAAAHDDIDALVESVAGLFREDSGQHDSLTDQGWPAREGAAYYSRLAGDQACLLLLARDSDSDSVVGHLVGRLSGPTSVQVACLAVLESMRVAPGSRRAGTGSLLVAAFLAWAREHGAQEASVTAYAANDTAQRFYERHGFLARSIILRAAL